MRFRATVKRQNAHSWYLSGGLALLAATLVIDLVFHPEMGNRWLIWLLLVFCLVSAFVVFLKGSRVPMAVGIVGVVVFMGAQCYFLGLSVDPQAAVSSLQQLPIVAFYLGWFIRPRWALPIITVATLSFLSVLIGNPLVALDGLVGMAVAVHALMIMLFCFAAGSNLWHRSVRAAATDALTGARTREAFMADMRRAAGRQPNRLAIILIDFDGLKRVNDTLGHEVGDLMLQETVREWRALLPDSVIGRLGGDEFAIGLPAVSLVDARLVYQALRADAKHRWSAGVAEQWPGEALESLIHRADFELYEIKRAAEGDRQ